MPARILVAYASEFGATRGVSEGIGVMLRGPDVQVDVRLLVDVQDLSPYTAAVVGSAIYNGAWLPEAEHFVRFFEAMLCRMPVAYFATCMTLWDDTPEHRRTVLSYLDPVRAGAPDVEPIDIGLFAGRLRYRNLPFTIRILFWLRAHLPSGDFRNWRAIRAWALQVRPALLGRQAMRADSLAVE